MTRDVLRVGIAGHGVVGRRRRAVIDRHPRLRTVAVCDQTFTEPCTGPDGVRCYPEYRRLLEEPLDVLFVSLPTYLAAEVTIAGLERGLHVFCEKPPGRDPAEVRRVIAAEHAHPDARLKYGFNHRYHASVKEAIRLIGEGTLGALVNLRGVYGKSKIVSFASGWRAERRFAGGGILLDQGIHMLDLMLLFCGDFTEVKSYVSNGYWHHDVEDNVYALLKDRQGRVGMLHSSATQWQHRFSLDIALTNGHLGLRGILSGSKSYGQEQLLVGRRAESDTGTARYETITYLNDDSWTEEVEEFASVVVHGEPILSGSSADALKAIELVHRIYEADDDWRRLQESWRETGRSGEQS
jgi:predicted dehydrogenase